MLIQAATISRGWTLPDRLFWLYVLLRPVLLVLHRRRRQR